MFVKALYVFLGFLMYFPAGNGEYGHALSICAFRGSSVDLPCPDRNPNSSMKWYSVNTDNVEEVPNDFSADGYNATYKITQEKNFTLTINTSLTESDVKSYCCTEETSNKDSCRSRTKPIIQLHLADLQVKVIPATEGQTVTLMCSSSCRLTETPLSYVWYRNGELLYEDWSKWYQELVSGDGTAAYSCAVKGYEDLRAPEVSVDSVTSACFTVTYAKGRMCSHHNKSEDEPCSITYPRELNVNIMKKRFYSTLTCSSSCPMSDHQSAYRWYWNKRLDKSFECQEMVIKMHQVVVIACAVKGHEDLLSDDVCSDEAVLCPRVNYASRRICALEGSSVDISCEYFTSPHSSHSRRWFKTSGGGEVAVEENYRIKYEKTQGHDTLRINDVKKNDSAEYSFTLHYDLPRVLLVVTGLKVTMTPSALVTEGQRVTLTCTTSCPLRNDLVFIWYMNGRPLTLPENRNKHLILDPISLGHAGNYTCVVISSKNNVSSAEESLAVNARDKSALIINSAKLAVLGLMLTAAFVLYMWMNRTKQNQASTNRTKDNVQTSQMDSLYESIALKPMNPTGQTEQELQEDPKRG